MGYKTQLQKSHLPNSDPVTLCGGQLVMGAWLPQKTAEAPG